MPTPLTDSCIDATGTAITNAVTAKTAWLVLENGYRFEGTSIGCEGTTFGELVFNTAMTGYQEILTDPSYKGQVVLMTYPEIGNYGVNTEDFESAHLHAAGFVVRRLSPSTSSCRAGGSLSAWLKQTGIVGIEGVDTRAITRLVRCEGALKCGITTDADRLPTFAAEVAAQPSLDDQPLVASVTTTHRYRFQAETATTTAPQPMLKKLVALDFGIKTNILRCLAPLVEELIVVPAFTSFETIMAENPDAVFLSNGPGDPRSLPSVIEAVQQLLAHNVPTFGICLGHQLLALAMGLPVEKMPFGHHGGNHPVKDIELNTISITSQNHGYCVQYPTEAEQADFMRDITVTHVNLNDQTIEGIRHNRLPAYSVQFHPEAAPGPQDSVYLFERFLQHCQQVTTGASRSAVSATVLA